MHRRLGHPSVNRMVKILKRAGHKSHRHFIEYLTKFCLWCQRYGKSPGRFSFTYKDDKAFNHTLVIDILFIQIAGLKKKQPVLHVIDEETKFNAARWLNNQSTDTV